MTLLVKSMSTEYDYNVYKIFKINIFKFTKTFKLRKNYQRNIQYEDISV